MTSPLPSNPDDWQTAYSRQQAYRDSARRTIGFLLTLKLPFLVVLLYSTISLVRHFFYGGYSGLEFTALAILTTLSALAGFLLVIKRAFAYAKDFFEKFHLPPVEVNPKKIIKYRLLGKTRLPAPLEIFSKFLSLPVGDIDIEKETEWLAWLSSDLGGPIELSVSDGCGLYLERGNQFSRVVGPGEPAPFLELHETIKYAVDLRPRVKTDHFSVWTKDGIQIKLTARMECRVGDPSGRKSESTLVFPFDPEAIRKAVEVHGLNWPDPLKNPGGFNWVDAAWHQVANILPGYIGGRKLDDLLVADQAGGQIPSADIAREIFSELNKNTQRFGVFVTDLQILKVDIPEEVKLFQQEYWKTAREGTASIIDTGESESGLPIQEKARADARQAILLAITDGLEKAKSEQSIEALFLALKEILDVRLSDPLLRASLGNETLETFERIQKLLIIPAVESPGGVEPNTT